MKWPIICSERKANKKIDFLVDIFHIKRGEHPPPPPAKKSTFDVKDTQHALKNYFI